MEEVQEVQHETVWLLHVGILYFGISFKLLGKVWRFRQLQDPPAPENSWDRSLTKPPQSNLIQNQGWSPERDAEVVVSGQDSFFLISDIHCLPVFRCSDLFMISTSCLQGALCSKSFKLNKLLLISIFLLLKDKNQPIHV